MTDTQRLELGLLLWKPWVLAAVFSVGIFVGGCDVFDEETERIEGKRISILIGDQELVPDAKTASLKVYLPRPHTNKNWPQAGGVASHVMGHLAAKGSLSPVWEESIGEGTNEEVRLLSTPIVADGRVFTIDTSSQVMAFDADTGEEIWDTNITPNSDDCSSDGTDEKTWAVENWQELCQTFDDWFTFGSEESMGGGLAYENGLVFITTGFAHLIALDAKDGKEVWRQSLPGPMRASPTVQDGRIFVITIDNQLVTLSTETGEKLWSHTGIMESTGMLGGASPAVAKGVVVVPYSSGELFALRTSNGRPLWSDNLGAVNVLDAVSSLSNIRGRPIIDGNRIIAISHSKRMVALDLRSGLRVWERSIGGIQSPWLAGDFIYLLTGENKLVCMTKADGLVVWVAALRKYEDVEDKEHLIIWSGPVLVGDRLIVMGSHGLALAISPYTGRLLGRVEMSNPVRIEPIVVGEMVYVLTEEADLIALR
ncbi:MAG: PQQ-binding-like beta-propeller repeat protein [Alphaproteobacteria bacterium]|nr:PQQ-binding-like beta-propeller repeat protein [Alphaproteobacteria bacterium]